LLNLPTIQSYPILATEKRRYEGDSFIIATTMPVTKNEIISEIQKYVAANGGKVPGEIAFESATRIKSSNWRGKFWARWTDAVREAGYDPTGWNQKIPDEELLETLAEFITTQARFPTRDEINLNARKIEGLPTWTTVKRRYGGMPEMAAALLEFAHGKCNDRLVALCEARIQKEVSKPVPVVSNGFNAISPIGFVYLKYSPSLRLFKIGKANDPNKRGVGISLLLPHDLIPKHEIKTDCPFLLEKYWEQRFKAKKKQGEWYDLTSADVETFKNRREFIFREYFP
jgi:hypothetical protein